MIDEGQGNVHGVEGMGDAVGWSGARGRVGCGGIINHGGNRVLGRMDVSLGGKGHVVVIDVVGGRMKVAVCDRVGML